MARPLARTLLVLVAIALAAGCRTKTTHGKPSVDEMYKAFISQQRTYAPLKLVAAPGQTISITGVGELTMESQLTPLSMRSSDPSTAAHIVDAITRMVGYGAAAWAIGTVANGSPSYNSTSVNQPTAVPIEEAVVEEATRPRIGPLR
jgi:hypothetical protein